MTGLLTTAVGSLPKPDYLARARPAFASGRIDAAELHNLTPHPTAGGVRALGAPLRGAPEGGRAHGRARPPLRHPLLPQADHHRRAALAGADDRRRVGLSPGPDGEAREGDAHRPLQDGRL